ncbi:MAG TPA: DUF4404 family protein [Verrucomicrobiae bacterium]|nr:DUF4404 family protein [Verrucomicrobiae bacterium]
MIQQIISDIEAKIRSGTMSESGKNELLESLARLKAEMAVLETDREKLKSLKSPVQELRSSVIGFEQSHPKLIQAVNSISSTLSNWGI